MQLAEGWLCAVLSLGARTEGPTTIPGLYLKSIIIFYLIEKLCLQPKVSSKLPDMFVDDFQDPNNTIMQNIMKTFHKAMKIRKYLRLSKNSLILSPVVGSLAPSPKPSVSLLLSLKFSTAPAFTSSVGAAAQSRLLVARPRPGTALGAGRPRGGGERGAGSGDSGWERSRGAMEVLGALQLGELAAAFAAVPVFPLFDAAYFIVSVLYLKYEPGAVEMSRKSPFASWLCAMLHCFGSYILADLLLGESPIHYFSNNSSVILATAIWYLIFFCPMNLFYKCVSFLPVKLIFVAMKEVVRVRKIAAGVHHAHHQYHHGWFIMMATGWVKGSGVALMSNFEQLLRGVWRPETNEILHMSFPTKASLYGTVLFTLQQTHWLPVSEANLIFFFTMFMIVCKVFMTATHSHASPFAPVEGFICPVFFGSVSSGHTSHHNQHGHSHEASYQPPPPVKSKEELNEGTRKRKAKKAE